LTKVLICGGRDFDNRDVLFTTLDDLNLRFCFSCVITGGAKGADRLAHLWAAKNHLDAKVYPANWERHGKMAGILRNREMLKEESPDLIVAFPGGRGTEDMVKIGRKAGVEVFEVESG